MKSNKVRYYLKRRDPQFEQKMAEVLCVYREVQVLKKAAAKSKKPGKPVAIVSYDESRDPGDRDDHTEFAACAWHPRDLHARS